MTNFSQSPFYRSDMFRANMRRYVMDKIHDEMRDNPIYKRNKDL